MSAESLMLEFKSLDNKTYIGNLDCEFSEGTKMIRSSSKRQPGRPKGSGTKDDSTALKLLASEMLANPNGKPMTVIGKLGGVGNASDVRRIYRKWLNQKSILVANGTKQTTQSVAHPADCLSSSVEILSSETLERINGTAWIRAAKQLEESPMMQAARALHDPPMMRAARDLHDSALMRAARELDNSPVMRAARELQDSHVMRTIRDMENSASFRAMKDAKRWAELTRFGY